MKDKLQSQWQQTPAHVRKPVVLVIGIFVILMSGAIGWLPGPGGIPLFLIGVAILATEFHWAHRLKNFVLSIVYGCGRWVRRHKILAAITICIGMSCSLLIAYMLFTRK